MTETDLAACKAVFPNMSWSVESLGLVGQIVNRRLGVSIKVTTTGKYMTAIHFCGQYAAVAFAPSLTAAMAWAWHTLAAMTMDAEAALAGSSNQIVADALAEGLGPTQQVGCDE